MGVLYKLDRTGHGEGCGVTFVFPYPGPDPAIFRVMEDLQELMDRQMILTGETTTSMPSAVSILHMRDLLLPGPEALRAKANVFPG